MGILKTIITKFYRLRMNLSKHTGLGISIASNEKKIKAPVSFYGLHATANNGEIISFEKFRNRKTLLVNLASKCGFTPQYDELEKLQQLLSAEEIISEDQMKELREFMMVNNSGQLMDVNLEELKSRAAATVALCKWSRCRP